MTDVTAYPLRWPEGWARTAPNLRKGGSRFRVAADFQSSVPGGETWRGTKLITFDRARKLLRAELERLGAEHIVLSTNVKLRNDGEPSAGAAERKLSDPGVAVYFKFRGKSMVMAQDTFEGIAANMRSLGLAIEAMRQLERHGGGTMMERAFTGFAAIAPPDWKKPWREVFGVKPDWTPTQPSDLTLLYRDKARLRHPDSGGSTQLMAELNVAYEAAKEELL